MRPIPKVFFFSLVIFLISFLPLLFAQPNSESNLKRLRGGDRDLTRVRGVESNLNHRNEHPFMVRGTPFPPTRGSSISPQEQKGIKSIIDDFLVNDDIAGECDQIIPAIARHWSGNFVIAWEDGRNGHWDIYAQRYDSSGTPLGSNFKVNDDAGTTLQMNPSIGMDGLGNFVIVWEDGRTGGYHIYAQRYDSSGSPMGSNFMANEETGTLWQWSPAIATHISGSFVISWTDERNVNNFHWDIYAQRYSASGAPLGSNFKVNDDVGYSYQSQSAIAIDFYGNFVIPWEDRRDGNYNVYAQRYDSYGSPVGSNFMVNDTATASEHPAIAMDVPGNFVICWYDSRHGHRDIYAQRYNSSGTPLGSNFKVNDDAGSTIQMLPDITMHDVGHFIITWTDERGIYKRDIYAQRYDSSGTPIGSNFSVNDNAGRSWHLFPAIAMDYLGNFVITWEDYRNIGGPDIYTQRYDSSATPLDSNFKVNDDVAAEQWLPAMALDGSHNFLITWSDDRNGSNNPDIYAQRYDSSGTPLGSNFRVNDDAGTAHQYSTAIAMDVSGNFVVTWEDWRYGNHDIYAQRYNSSGTPLGSNFKVNDEPEYADQESPSIAMDGSGNFVITWDDWRNGNHDIYAQRYNSSGTPLGSNFKVNDDAGSSDQRTPATAMDGSGNFVITWNDYRNGNCDIYAQRYEPSGTPLGSNFKVNDDPGTAHQHSPAITMDGSSNFVITWEDDRNGDFDIYAQRYDSSGTSLGSNFKVNDDPGSSDQRYPAIAVDSFGNFVITWEDYRNGSNGDIYAQRYDSSGNPLHSNYLVPNSDYASFSQIRPAVTANSSNIYFTWQDDRKVTSWDIYAKVVDWIWPSFCGDVNVDGVVDIADVVYLLNYFFLFGPPPVPIEAGDVNLDGTVNGADVIYLVNYLFIGGPPPCS